MLNINLQVKSEDRKIKIGNNLEQLSKEYGITPFHKQGYRKVIRLLREDQKKTILFCIDHWCSNRAFVHLQGNPSELDKILATSMRGDLDYLSV